MKAKGRDADLFVPNGGNVLISVSLLHRSEDQWADPSKYIPGKFYTLLKNINTLYNIDNTFRNYYQIKQQNASKRLEIRASNVDTFHFHMEHVVVLGIHLLLSKQL